ncbi:MAG: short chain dehydrogenase [Allomuricauda sp.]|nr:MAG: short chain dehydrogenase [Allomuricauda sp.]
MRILIIGGHGTIGKKVTDHFKKQHEVIVAGRTQGDVTMDISDRKSIENALRSIGHLDAIINASGEAKWAPFNELSEEDYYIGFRSKLMGQVNLVRIGQHYLNTNGSITLSTGFLADRPVPMTASAAMVNGAIHSFVQAVALELEGGLRVNVVSSGLVEDAYERYKDYFPGHAVIPMDTMVEGYVKSVMGNGSGEIIRIYD